MNKNNKLDELVQDLFANNLWSKLKSIYPISWSYDDFKLKKRYIRKYKIRKIFNG